jgi:hypothetical protein
MTKLRTRRFIAFIITALCVVGALLLHPDNYAIYPDPESVDAGVRDGDKLAMPALMSIEIKGRAPSTGYSRDQFGGGWVAVGSCDTRNVILARDLQNYKVDQNCKVLSGRLYDPYTSKIIEFRRGVDTSDDVQNDHIVALSDAWQSGAKYLAFERRIDLANDPLELLAVEGQANQDKGASNAASWLPPNKAFRCQYVARQIAVKLKYGLWVTRSEHEAMSRVLSKCPSQILPISNVK